MTRRVLYFDTTGRGGGSNVSLLTLLKHLNQIRYLPCVAVGTAPKDGLWAGWRAQAFPLGRLDNYDFFPASWDARWVYHFLLLMLRLPWDIVRAWCFIRRQHPDLVHINTGQAIAFGIAARLARIPTIWHIRELLARNALGRWQQRLYGFCASRVIANSRAVARRLHCIADRVVVIPNAVDISDVLIEQGQAFRQTLNIPHEAFVVLMLGGLTENKGALFLAEVARRIQSPKVYFILAGPLHEVPASGIHLLLRRVYRGLTGHRPESARIREAWSGMPRSVFSGVVRPPEALAACDLVVCPNVRAESFGRTVIEANAYGRLVIATPIEPFDETIHDGHNGWLIPLDAEMWRRRIEELAIDREALAALAGQARQHARAYDAQEHTNTIMRLYDQVLDRRIQ